MNEIIIQTDYGVIVFHDKTTKYIDEDQFNNIVVAYTNPNITKLTIGQNLYSKSSISKILTLDEYWKEYPKAEPIQKFDNQFKKYEGIEQIADTKNGLASMIKGLKRFIDKQYVKGINTPNAQGHLDHLMKAYDRQYGSPPPSIS
jgi:hypothetical protein